jgi:NAD(P)-dependent dehydrogenase (short-subunit alcohol dehydrogenase family)
MSFADRVAVVTGASSGIGRALAEELARQGCKVGVLARRQAELEELCADIASAGGTARWATADVGEREEVHRALGRLAEELGPPDLVVANAGVGGTVRIDPFDASVVERVYRVNVFGVLHVIEAVLPEMLRRGTGHLAAVSSQGAYKALPGYVGYTSSKAALNHFLEGFRLQLRPRGITVTTILPGFVRTPLTARHRFKMPWLLEPEDAARRIVRALGRRKEVFAFPWQTAWLMRLAGWLPDWAVLRLAGRYPAE